MTVTPQLVFTNPEQFQGLIAEARSYEFEAAVLSIDVQCCFSLFADCPASSDEPSFIYHIGRLIDNGNLDFVHFRLPSIPKVTSRSALNNLAYVILWCQRIVLLGGGLRHRVVPPPG